MTDIPNYASFAKIEPLNKGWSGDMKYQIETSNGEQLLLRIADIDGYDRKKAEYEMIQKAAVLGIPVSQPVNFGLCAGGEKVYSLLTWVEGADVESVLSTYTETEQYVAGIKAGEVLYKLHTLPALETTEPWSTWFERKLQGRIDYYHANSIESDNGDLFIRYLQENKHLMDNRPQTFNHGDYNIANLIAMPKSQIGLVDFNFHGSNHGYGDPWWEFCAISWESELSPHFHTGMLKGYFNGNPPQDFFEVNSYYFAYSALATLCDVAKGEEGNPEDGKRHVENILRWFDNMRNPVPTWYLKDFYVQHTDGVPNSS